MVTAINGGTLLTALQSTFAVVAEDIKTFIKDLSNVLNKSYKTV